MALKVSVTIKIENQAYEGAVENGVAVEETGWASGAPGNFAFVGRESLDMLVESAIENAQKRLTDKLDILKPNKD